MNDGGDDQRSGSLSVRVLALKMRVSSFASCLSSTVLPRAPGSAVASISNQYQISLASRRYMPMRCRKSFLDSAPSASQ